MQILRQALGLFFIIFGITKIIPVLGFGYGFGGTVWFVGTAMAYPLATVLVLAAIVVEIVLGLVLLAPQLLTHVEPLLKTDSSNIQKYAAYGLAAFTALATLMFHVPLVGGETLTTELTSVLKNLVIIAGLYAVGKEIS
jgi:uncharacterized membrane protein YphA (DoxX/SURF4 family)